MEEKQLDLAAPLLSVRRIPSKLTPSERVSGKKIDKQLSPKQQSLPLIKSGWEVDEVTKPAAVPFLWEQTPGRPKDGSDPEGQSPVEPVNTPRLPPGRKLDIPKQVSEEESFKPQVVASPLRDCAALLKSLNNEFKAEGELDSEEDEYSDALDTLSPAETFSLNCSSNGYGASGVKVCGDFSSVDRQAQEFMMSRFLPAAKAVVVDTPQYVSKKQSITPEWHRPVTKVIRGDGRPVLAYGQYIEDMESEDEDEDYEYSTKKSVKASRLFSRLCLKNSLCLLNPVPGMKERAKSPACSARAVNRLARTALSGPLTQIADKNIGGALRKQKLSYVARSHELQKAERKPGSSPCMSFRKDNAHLYQKKAPPFSFQGEVQVPGVISTGTEDVNANKIYSNFVGASCHVVDKQVSGLSTPAVEKTLYMDSASSGQFAHSESIYSGAEGSTISISKDYDSSGNSSRRIEKGASTESSVQDKRPNDLAKGSISTNESLDDDNNRMEEFLQLSNSNTYGELNKNIVKINNAGAGGNHKNDINSSFSPRPPPLPKSPTESWLWCTLPSLSLRHYGTCPEFNSQRQQPKASIVGAKWETIVKTSNMHHDHVRYSKELVPRVPPH